jgi:hypothetical protein
MRGCASFLRDLDVSQILVLQAKQVKFSSRLNNLHTKAAVSWQWTSALVDIPVTTRWQAQ